MIRRLDERFSPQENLVGHVDIKRLKCGKSGGVFLSVYVDWYIFQEEFVRMPQLTRIRPEPENDFSDSLYLEPMRDTMQQIDLVYRLVDQYADDLRIVDQSKDIMATFNAGKLAVLISLEGLHQIGNSSSVLRNFYRLGVRCVALAHNRNNLYADCAVCLPLFRISGDR